MRSKQAKHNPAKPLSGLDTTKDNFLYCFTLLTTHYFEDARKEEKEKQRKEVKKNQLLDTVCKH